jgi:hypothetical protein
MFGTFAESDTVSPSPNPSSPHPKLPLKPTFTEQDVYIKFTHVCSKFALIWLKSVFTFLLYVRDVRRVRYGKSQPQTFQPTSHLKPIFTDHDVYIKFTHVYFKFGWFWLEPVFTFLLYVRDVRRVRCGKSQPQPLQPTS